MTGKPAVRIDLVFTDADGEQWELDDATVEDLRMVAAQLEDSQRAARRAIGITP